MKPPQVGCLPARRGADHHPSIVVPHLEHGPGAAAEKEAAHAVDEAVDELLVERTERLAAARLHGVALRAREDGEELHEVPPAEATLRLRPEDEPAAGADERLVADHPLDEPVELLAADAAEVGDAGQMLPGRLRARRRRRRATSRAAGG